MYDVRLEYFLWNRDRTTVERWIANDLEGIAAKRPPKVTVLARTVRLPFVPVAGQRVRLADWDCGTIRSVCWDDGSRTFHCQLDDDCPAPDDTDIAARFLQHLESALATGWRIAGGDALLPLMPPPARERPVA
jgi:hypothetical protein